MPRQSRAVPDNHDMDVATEVPVASQTVAPKDRTGGGMDELRHGCLVRLGRIPICPLDHQYPI